MDLARVQKPVRQLRKLLKELTADPEPAQVHRLRTHTRRIEAATAVLDSTAQDECRRLLKALKPLRKASGGVREMDVLSADLASLRKSANPVSLGRLADHLREVRDANAGRLSELLDRHRKRARRRLKEFARAIDETATGKKPVRSESSAAQSTCTSTIGRVEVLAAELASWPELNSSNLHDFRLKAKELRYVLDMDPAADPQLIGALGRAKGAIGKWHDWQQLRVMARDVLNPSQDRELLAQIESAGKQKLTRALTASSSLRKLLLAGSQLKAS
jgi:CHAD domain-containing protein